jgi:hypothetical protein
VARPATTWKRSLACRCVVGGILLVVVASGVATISDISDPNQRTLSLAVGSTVAATTATTAASGHTSPPVPLLPIAGVAVLILLIVALVAATRGRDGRR